MTMQTVAQLDLRECPIGLVLNRADPDDSVETRFFADWDEPYREPLDHRASYRAWLVLDDEASGERVLQHDDKRLSGLVTGTRDWTDYRLSARLRPILPTTLPNTDDEYSTVARSGLVFRQQSTRRYYFFGALGHDRWLLACREDETWRELGSVESVPDRSRYTRLTVELQGEHIRCYLDDARVLEVTDARYPTGGCGIRTDSLSRWAELCAEMDAAARQTALDRAATREQVRRTRASHYPAIRVRQTLSFPGQTLVGFGRHPETAHPTLLLRERGDGNSVSARSWDGQELWRRDLPGGVRSVCGLGDMTGNGASDLLAMGGGRMLLLDGVDGLTRAEAATPKAGPFMGPRGVDASQNHAKRGILPTALRLRPAPAAKGIVFREDGSPGSTSIWGYDAELRQLWTTHVTNPRYGHNIQVLDLDGDGLDEFLLGGYLIGSDGQVRWRLSGSEYWDRYNGARHVDGGFIAPLGPEDAPGLHCVLACGAEGIIFADPLTGAVRHEAHIGHVQTVVHGRFRADLDGRQIWAFNRHGNFGICTLYDRHGQELMQVQPHYELFRGRPVTWLDDGPQLLFMNSHTVRGLYDADFLRLAELPDDMPVNSTPIIRDIDNDGLDELLVRQPDSLHIYSRA